MKKVNFNVAITNVKGETMKSGGEDMFVKDVICHVLSATKPKNASKDSIRLLHLALDIYKSKEEMNIEDADFESLKEIVGKNEASYTVLVLGQVFKVIEDAEKPKVSEEKK